MGRLILSRRKGERIRIGDNIVIEVVQTTSGRCRLGILAPPEVRVDREEIHQLRLAAPSETVEN